MCSAVWTKEGKTEPSYSMDVHATLLILLLVVVRCSSLLQKGSKSPLIIILD